MNTRKNLSERGRSTKQTGAKNAPKSTKPSATDKPKVRDSKPQFRNKTPKGDPLPSFNEDEIRLNKYLSNAGVCSRREADVMIQTGVVTVNGVVITEMGYKVKKGDKVQYDGETINAETKRYVLLNKPKGFITTMDDPLGRKTVMTLVAKACKERVYPVGRLDRATTGLLLFTNDGDMAKKLTHPRYQAKKIYHVETDIPVKKEDLEKIMSGVELEDGWIKADHAEYVKDNKSSREIGIEIHSGKNRIVRRIFERLGYEVVKLDRVQFASLTKKDLPRGYYRHLTEQEVNFLKMTK
jgi:23S rRNA pseudouridine2605 synthase